MGFLTPHSLFWGLSLALLVAIYLRSRSRPTIEVSSLMLFDEAPAPVASVRHVRLDLLFWLEAAALTTLTLAVAGLYIKMPPPPGHGRSHALVFDLGAGMSARDGLGTRLDTARIEAIKLVDNSPIDDEFSVIGYALDAQVTRAPSSNRTEVRQALDTLTAMAVPARAAALRAALMRARGASEIDLFADRPPPAALLADVPSSTRLNFHQVGAGDGNVAIVSLDPGVPASSKGRVVLRNFSIRPRLAEVVIDQGSDEALHQNFMLAPREQMVVKFGPLKAGGVLQARILTSDAIEADNSRYALAPVGGAARVLVLSPAADVRDDLARTLLAVDSNFQITTADPAHYQPPVAPVQPAAGQTAADTDKPFELAVLHDCWVPGIAASSTLLIYPPAKDARGIAVEGTLTGADLHDADSLDSAGGGFDSASAAMLGSTRLLALPEWMDSSATASAAGHRAFPVAAEGRAAGENVGVIAFDVRDHLLLDPDHLDALVVTVDMIKRLTAPRSVQIVQTGAYVRVPALGTAKLTQPDGVVHTIAADKWGRAGIRPLQAGRYVIESGNLSTIVLANYYDATESDLSAASKAAASAPPRNVTATSAEPTRQVRPLIVLMLALALLALMFESAMLVRRAARWGMRHV